MEDKTTETTKLTFNPSKNILLLPILLFFLGLGMFMYSIFTKMLSVSETRFLSWGCMIAGAIGSGLSYLHRKRYLLRIMESSMIFIPDQLANENIEVDLHHINQVEIQQSAVGRFLRYGNVHIKYDEGDLDIIDIESPDQIKRLLSVS
jgi:hypothetical protein